jgi:RNA polymerase sigma-70 factor, ECF subfamily
MDDASFERARAGDRVALEALLDEIAPQIHRFGSRMCRHQADAEDVVQDTLLSVATHLSDFEGRSSLSSWVFALARTACARKRRGLKNRPHLPEQAAPERHDHGASPEAELEQRELRAKLEAALASLSDEHREVVLLRDVEGLTAKEAAASIGIGVDAVKSRLHRARAALREAFAPTVEPTPSAQDLGCPDVVAALSRKLEGDLDPFDCQTFEAHVADCARCGALCDQMRGALDACRAAAGAPVPEAVRARVRAALDALAEKEP